MKGFLIGLSVGIMLAFGFTANAGIISHVVAYEVGKSAGKDEAKAECKCPEPLKQP